MTAHKVDKFGFAVDPELRQLEIQLCRLAGRWGFCESPCQQEAIVREYHATMTRLYSLGWDAVVNFECELQYELMPEEYRRRHPRSSSAGWGCVSCEQQEDE